MDNNFNNNIPIYIQLLEQIKINIISGKLKSGDKLPSVRELSTIYKVNPNTMQKALGELENQNLIYTERTNGKYVTNDSNVIHNAKIEYANKIANEYLCNMKKIGINELEAIKYLKGKDDI